MSEMWNLGPNRDEKRPAARQSIKVALAAALGGMALLLAIFFIGCGQLGARPAAPVQGVVVWPDITLTQTVSGLSQPLHVAHAGDGSGRLFVVEKAGVIRIVQGGAVLPTHFLSITHRVGSSGGEQGLLSVAFPPDYASKGYLYVNYTDVNGDTVVSRFYITADPDVADPASEQIILTIDQPYTNHNGGQLAFGPDGYLYIGMGDGGSGGDPDGNGQDPATLLGAILRIDVEPAPPVAPVFTPTHWIYLPLVLSQNGNGGLPYDIPPTNPFTQTAGYRAEIWAWGLRNPWRFSFDRETGDLYIGDVGQNNYEEINFQPADSGGGENYGWAIMEGNHCYPSGPCNETGLVLPVAEYDHSLGCSVTGGVVYRGTTSALQGIYFFGDYCSGRIWGLAQEAGTWSTQILATTGLAISSFGEDEAGNVYLTDFWNGAVYQIDED